MEQHLLFTGSATPCWEILIHPVDMSRFALPNCKQELVLTLSVKYQTYGGSMLQMVFRSIMPDGRINYLATRRCSCDQYMNIDSLTVTIPENLLDGTKVEVAVYLNHSHEQAVVKKLRLEIGDTGTMFD